MKKTYLLLTVFLCLGISVFAAKNETKSQLIIKSWLKAGDIPLHYPAFHLTKDVENKTFLAKDLLKEEFLSLEALQPAEGDTLFWTDQSRIWQAQSVGKNDFLEISASQDLSLSYYVAYISAGEWMKAKLQLSAFPMLDVYLNGKQLTGTTSQEKKKASEVEKEIILEQGKHTLVVKVLTAGERGDFKVSLTPGKDWDLSYLEQSLSPKHFITINNVLNGSKVKGAQISADGDLVLLSFSQTLPPSDKSDSWKEIRDLKSGRLIHSFRGSELGGIQWLPKGKKISFTRKLNGAKTLYVLDFENGTEKEIGTDLKDMADYQWAPDASYVIYSVSKDYSEEWKIRKIQGMEDRLPWFRSRSFLYKLDAKSGVKQRLTFGALSTNLQDISPDGRSILFSQSRPDYKEYPYDKQNLYRMDLATLKVDTIWKDKLFGGSAQFSPDGEKLLVQGGPSCFGKMGENIGKQPLANNYDGQLYIMDLTAKKVDPITFDFDPSVNNAVWNRNDGNIYIKADDKDYVGLYRYNPENREFTPIVTGVDVIKGMDFSVNTLNMVYTGCSISTPYQAFALDLKSEKYSVIANPEKENLRNVTFGKTEDWNFTKEDGKTIIGRVYYPPNFDPNKKYPLIVNYYAGTSPVERSFGGRYPLNLYAANGYVVYLLQPSGAIGFGQEFSAEHQNNWGKTTADEIIEGTKKFLKDHPFVDPKKVGCIGASYGGFMTMYLQTRTDIFAAAIAHAGISSISSYWGEGYWGYSYSVNASGHSFPWNNRDLYFNQSPLFNADRINTPILLIHGSVDTNVPPGESIQMYQALKLQGKDVELVLVKNQDHHILNYTQRILWNNTIFAYFAKYLKDQPQWWDELYPDKNL